MRPSRVIFLSGLLITLLVAYFNQGIIAVDDYAEGIARFIPAQFRSFSENIDTTGIRFPFQSLFFLSLSKLALYFGFMDPTAQLRFVLIFVGVSVFSLQFFSTFRILEKTPYRMIGLFLMSFYFVMPLIYTRPLIENLGGAFITSSVLFASLFYETRKKSWVFWSVISIFAASLFRLQALVCLAALPLLFIKMKGKKTCWILFLISIGVGFFLTGILDWSLTGGFQKSRIAYLTYNLEHSSSYGTTPFYTFILLFLGLSLPPTFVGSYRAFKWKEHYRPLVPTVLFFLVFLLSHSLVPHKEERFMIPILPLFLILLTPLGHFWIFEKRNRWRPIYFVSLNSILLGLASFSTPQTNVISIVRYLDKEYSIAAVYNYKDSIILFPSAFALRPLKLLPMDESLENKISDLRSCESLLAVRQDYYERDFNKFEGFKVVKQFHPGPLESLLVKLNPRQNARRGAIYLLKDTSCD